MPRLSWWKRSLMLLGVAAAGLAGLAAHPRRGDGAGPPPQAEAKNQYRGSVRCRDCHVDGTANKYGYAKDFVRLDEYKTWNERDKHSLAYRNLTGPRGKQMAGLLKVDVLDKKAGCIGCHGASEVEATERFPGDTFDPMEGVSCENCHGPSSNWWLSHADPRFRKTPSAEREKIGLVDLRSPARQADQCLSCHIGSAGGGKVVTHDMYAAGHPPLPSIEVATFSDVIPRHWWLDGEKPSEPVRKEAGFKEGEKERTRLSIVGAAVALKTTMALVADESKADGTTAVSGLDWPDYARYDCWSCHHDLKRESWRQARGFEGSPGRPPLNEWPLAMVELGIDRLELNDPSANVLRGELAAHQRAVLKAVDARPYGLKGPMAEAARGFADWSAVLIRRLEAATYDDAVALRLLRKLVARAGEQAEKNKVDYDAARHVAWTIKILVDDAGPKLPNRPAFDPVLKKFEDGLKLKIPAGREYQIEDQIGQALRVIGDYEPSEFRDHLRELAALLPKE